jgi:hypothetical protein
MATVDAEVLRRFVGGQIETRNEKTRSVYRGEIKTIAVELRNRHNWLAVTLNWVAIGNRYPVPTSWVRGHVLTYEANLDRFSITPTGNGRMSFYCQSLGHLVTIYLPHTPGSLQLARVRDSH